MFENFTSLIRERFDFLSKSGKLYTVDTTRDELWDIYLNSFPEGSNKILKERRDYDCNTCKNFIRDVGNVVAIIDGKIQTVWDVKAEEPYLTVTKALAEHVRNRKIDNIFLHRQNTSGAKTTNQLLEDKSVKTWNHFSCKIPKNFVNPAPGEILNLNRTSAQVFERSLVEISESSIDITIELMNQGSLYRGDEFKVTVLEFQKLKREFSKLQNPHDINVFVWENVGNPCSRIRNTVIGTLLTDISTDVDLDVAVRSFESKVAPTNYKRPTALITKGMIEQAMKTVQELGIESSLKRRFAVPEDLTINNVIFTGDSANQIKVSGSLEETLMKESKNAVKDLSKVEEVPIEKFIKDILPNVTKMQIYVENKHVNNLVSLIAPVDKDAPNILKWKNNFSWSYNGDITDSIKERVKTAGGNVNAFLRVSLSWFNFDDLDIHVQEPGRTAALNSHDHIYYGNKISHRTGGNLDVDMNAGHGTFREPVENVVWTDKNRIVKGWYTVTIHNFCKCENKDVGFELQTEFNGESKTYSFKEAVKDNHNVKALRFHFDGNEVTEVELNSGMEESGKSKVVWNIKTNDFVDTTMLTISPNHWDDNNIGNKHFFFMLKDCKNEAETRGLYNEFLDGKLDKHRKVFEVIGNKLKCEKSDRQLSGVGFSSTKRDAVVCKVEGKFNRTLKIKF